MVRRGRPFISGPLSRSSLTSRNASIDCVNEMGFLLNFAEAADDRRGLLRAGREHAAGGQRGGRRAARDHDEQRPAHRGGGHFDRRLYRRVPRHLQGTLKKGMCNSTIQS